MLRSVEELRRPIELADARLGTVTLGLWNASDAEELDAIVWSLPLYEWMTVAPTMLSPHPSDPVGTVSSLMAARRVSR